MSGNTEVRAVSPMNKIWKPMTRILLAVTLAALWVGVGAVLVGMLFHPVGRVAAENIKTDITADFEYMLTKKLSGIGELDNENVAFGPVKREYSLDDKDMESQHQLMNFL